MARLCERAGRFAAENGGSWPGQVIEEEDEFVGELGLSHGGQDAGAGAASKEVEYDSVGPGGSALATSAAEEASAPPGPSAHAVKLKSGGKGVAGEGLKLRAGELCVSLHTTKNEPDSYYTYEDLAIPCCWTCEIGFVLSLESGESGPGAAL
jgi:hypothetical protein